MPARRRYLFLSAFDEGITLEHNVIAESVEEAIQKVDLFPYTYPDDFEYYLNEIRRDAPDAMLPYQKTREEALDQVLQFYGVRYKGFDPHDMGNFIDGDSNRYYKILEIPITGRKITCYPKDPV